MGHRTRQALRQWPLAAAIAVAVSGIAYAAHVGVIFGQGFVNTVKVVSTDGTSYSRVNGPTHALHSAKRQA